MSGRIHAVVGTRGRVGTTTVAVGLAAGLRSRGEEPLLVDTDVAFPDVGAYLDLDPAAGLPAVVEGTARFCDAVDFGAVPGTDVEVAALPCPRGGGAAARSVGPDDVRDLLGKVEESFDEAVVDTGTGLTGRPMAAVGAADDAVVVFRPDGSPGHAEGTVGAVRAACDGPVRAVVNGTDDRGEARRAVDAVDPGMELLAAVPHGAGAMRTLSGATVRLGAGRPADDGDAGGDDGSAGPGAGSDAEGAPAATGPPPNSP